MMVEGLFGLQKPLMLLLLTGLIPLTYLLIRTDEAQKIVFSKMILLTLISATFASPFVMSEENLSETPEVTILSDNSRSTQILEEYDPDFENVQTNTLTVGSDNSSELKTDLLRNLEENTQYLLLSDGQTDQDLKEVATRFKQVNSSLSIVRLEAEEESSVYIEGPSETVIGAENEFKVKVSSTSDGIPEPSVEANGERVQLVKNGNSYSFTRSFSEPGTVQISASINSEDVFSDNNQYFKTVKVREKPEILVLGSKSSMGDKLEEFYDITYRNTLPDDLSPYYAVFAKKEFDPAEMTDYVIEGNGVIYNGDLDEQNYLLPSKKGEGTQTDGAKIMIVVDASFASGKCENQFETESGNTICTRTSGEGGSVKESIQIAGNLTNSLPPNNKVGLIAYNDEAYLFSKPSPLLENRDYLLDQISRIEPEGPSLHYKGLEGAGEILKSGENDGNVILISEGETTYAGVRGNTTEAARNLDARLITVGVGEDPNEDFLRDVARETEGGFYLEGGESGKLSFTFKGGGAASTARRLIVMDGSHYITNGLNLDTSTTGFKNSETKRGARLLVSSTSGAEFLSSWHYGLGRVAQFTGGTSNLGNVMQYDPLLLTRTVSWAVGDPVRKEDEWIKIEDSSFGNPIKIEASYQIGGLNRRGEDLYVKTFTPAETGFRSFNGTVYGYNYNPEVQEVGYNTEIESVVNETGGNIYSPGEETRIEENLKQFSQRKVERKKFLTNYLLVAILLVFLAEVGYRKMTGRK